jgi:hypothetical protein
MADWGQFLLAGGAGVEGRTVVPGEKPPRELLDYFNRISHTNERGASIPAFSGRNYSLAEISLDNPRDAKALSVHVHGARQTYGLGYEETLQEAAREIAVGGRAEALDWPIPYGSRERAVEGYTGHVPLAKGMIGLTTAERVRLSEKRIVEGKLFRPECDLRYEPAAQPHAGFPYNRAPTEGLAAHRQRMVDAQRASSARRADELRATMPIATVRDGALDGAAAAEPRVRTQTNLQFVFESGEGALGPHQIARNTFVASTLAPPTKVWGQAQPVKSAPVRPSTAGADTRAAVAALNATLHRAAHQG